MSNHPSTCNPYCGIQHCTCGQPAAHGSKQCHQCASRERGWAAWHLALLAALTVAIMLWLNPYRGAEPTVCPQGQTVGVVTCESTSGR
jgi:hypothetical protein